MDLKNANVPVVGKRLPPLPAPVPKLSSFVSGSFTPPPAYRDKPVTVVMYIVREMTVQVMFSHGRSFFYDLRTGLGL